MKSQTDFLGKFLRALAILAAVTLVFLLGSLAAFLWQGHLKDIHTWKKSPGVRADAGHLDPQPMDSVISIAPDSAQAIIQIRAALLKAHARRLKIAVSGARHSMGGQSVTPGGLVLDMLPHRAMNLGPKPDSSGDRLLRVQTGARWSDVIAFLDAHGLAVRIMQSNNPFTVGGTLSVNAHGWQQNKPPFVSSVKAFRLLGADGVVRNCSRAENRELFRCDAGGYGLFGVILDVDLCVDPNRLFRAERFLMAAAEYPARYHALVDGDSPLGAGLAAGVMPSTPGTDRFSEETQYRAWMIGVGGDGVTQRVRQGQDPMPDGNLSGQDMVDQIRRALGHAPSHATGAEAPALATEAHQMAFAARCLKQAS